MVFLPDETINRGALEESSIYKDSLLLPNVPSKFVVIFVDDYSRVT